MNTIRKTGYGFRSQRIGTLNRPDPRSPIEGSNTQGGQNPISAGSDRGQGPGSNPREIVERARAMVNPFDVKTALLAKHAQHVALVHFPIALFTSAVAFDLIAHWTKRRDFADTAYYNLVAAAISGLPVLATGILAWQFQLEGQKLKGILLLHSVLAGISSVMIGLAWWVHFRARRRVEVFPSYRFAIEFLGVGIVVLTGHLGGFLSGVNGPG